MAAPPGAVLDGALAALAATQAQHTATLAHHTATLAQLTATQAQHTALLGGIAHTLAQIQVQLAPLNVAAIAGAASRVVLATAAARALNANDRRGVPLTPVPRDDGTLPPNWPAGFDRGALHDGAIATVDLMLGDYGLAHGAAAGTHIVRRNILAGAIGTMLF